MKKIALMIIIALTTISCAPKPVVVDIQQSKDAYLDCKQINAAISTTEYYKKAARNDDRFMFRYIFPPTGFIAMYRFNKAEGNAIKRIEYLESLASKRRCGNDYQPQMINPQMNNGQIYNHYQNNREPIFVPNAGY